MAIMYVTKQIRPSTDIAFHTKSEPHQAAVDSFKESGDILMH